jgi:hypothetical protein
MGSCAAAVAAEPAVAKNFRSRKVHAPLLIPHAARGLDTVEIHGLYNLDIAVTLPTGGQMCHNQDLVAVVGRRRCPCRRHIKAAACCLMLVQRSTQSVRECV